MSMTTTETTGGQFLLDVTSPSDVFTPEDFDETQRMIADTVREFFERSIKPHVRRTNTTSRSA
jgi:hypothetical protein